MTLHVGKSGIGGLLERLFETARRRAGVARPESIAAPSDGFLNLLSALDEIDDGIILLDRDLCVEFINRAACEFGGIRKPAPGRRLSFVDLIRKVHASRMYAGVAENIDDFVAQRMESVQRGDARPVELRFANGKILQTRCSALPNGGRLITYSDVTCLVRRNEELETLRAALDQVRHGVILLDQDLRARFINRALRQMTEMPDAFADAAPSFEAILQRGRERGAFAVPDEEIDDYIAERITMVRDGNVTPREVRWSAGRVARFQVAPLPGGGRMLTYVDITDLAHTTDQLEKLAITDGLTGLYNRRHFVTLAEREWSRYERYRRPLSMILLDIDLFKQVNDSFGHDVGDQLIFHVANLCMEYKRDTDSLARVGGEEFALLLPETELESACLAAERLRRAIADCPLITESTTIPITISAGVAEADPGMQGVSGLMKLADRMLYKAKHAGRNHVMTPRMAENLDAGGAPRLALLQD